MPRLSATILPLAYCLLISSLSLISHAKSPSLDHKKIQQIMHKLQIPGAAIGIIKNGQVHAAQGYGVKTIGKNSAVDSNSIFKIASNSKAFTAAALAILVDQGKISWHGKVQDYLTDFTLHDPWVSKEFNLIDLLTHRSGLGLGAGDLMLWPEPSSFSRQEVLHNLRYLKPTGEFRSDYAYDNLLYIVAGEVIPAVTGISWEAFVERRIMQPLGMKHCFAGKVSPQKQANVATPHGIVDGKLQTIIRPIDVNKPSVSAPAGGIQCSLNDMLTWVKVQLNQGQTSEGQPLFSKAQHKMMWTPHTIMPVSSRSKRLDNTHLSAYGLGWRINDMDGYLQVHHTGSLAGMYSFVSLFPELDLGFVVLTNQQSSAARSALMYTAMKPFLGDTTSDWLTTFSPLKKPSGATSRSNKPTNKFVLANKDNTDFDAFIGTYQDPWLGKFFIEQVKNSSTDKHVMALKISSQRVKKFVGTLYQQDNKDSLLIRWHDRSLEADAIIYLDRDHKANVKGMHLRPASKDIDFSYDFQDLNFTKLSATALSGP
ncbi:serine hydrolase [uncultured Paraglaciecola sp.]|uniref:serine hydrolase domain-containing protein n=1 Tax=uncultured Paraglaciecola sp. TaxID=1765024 RepID=UPI00260569E9|nr:serine hydrolase domain-containing protein [uncultured Paraglaciecola sp.]